MNNKPDNPQDMRGAVVHKYTPDGKKVAVLGQLNSTSWIVQEIYVAGGNEFPAGESFVAKTLLDAPAKTWAKTQQARWEKAADDAKRKIEHLQLQCRVARRQADVAGLIKTATAAYAEIDMGQLETLAAFMTGQITHVVQKTWAGFEVLPLANALESTDDGRFDGLKLVSLFGCNEHSERPDDDAKRMSRSHGFRLDYRINRYRDGSGDWDTIHPCKSIEEAKEYIDAFIADQDATDKLIALKERYGLSNPTPEKIAAYRVKCVESEQSQLATAQATVLVVQLKLAQLRDAAKAAQQEVTNDE